MNKFKHTFEIGPLVIEITKNVIDGGYNVWLYLYPTGKPRETYVENGELGLHDLTLTFVYGSADDPEWCEFEKMINLNELVDEALKTACSNDEDLRKVEAKIVLHSSNGPSVHYKANKYRSGDSWSRWEQDVLAIGFWVSDETGRKMIEKLKEVTKE